MSGITEENYIYYLLNENNKYVNREFINGIFKKMGITYVIKDIEIFQEGLIHETYCIKMVEKKKLKIIKLLSNKDYEMCKNNNVIQLQEKCYERLEFLGDSIIHAIIADYLYDRYEEDQGFMTTLRSKLVNAKILAVLSKKVKLNEYVMIGRFMEQEGDRDIKTHLLEDIMEAFIGALFIDSGRDYDICKEFIVKLIEQEVDFARLLYDENNYKDILLRYYHRMKWEPPKYKLIEQIGDDKKIFKMGVMNNDGKIIGIGCGTTKRNGEQYASKIALMKFGVISNDD